MKRILLIKLTSLGDLIHALPALTDAMRAHPGLKFDWVIDENFAEVAKWHESVEGIYTTNHRLWRKGLLDAIGPISRLVQEIRKTRYDLIIDGQGNFKTALMSLFLKGPTAGFDRHSVRETIASFAYQRKYPASKSAHAIDRLRQLFALSLDYPCPTTPPEFLINRDRFVIPSLLLPEKYIVFIHNASWKTKLWPEEYGKRLMEMIAQRGYTILLPWGNREEKERAERMACNNQVQVLPKLSLSEIGFVLSKALACVCMDTGLSHLVAALNIPSVTLYGSTDSGLIGASGKNQRHLQSTLSCAPCNKKKCRFPTVSSISPPCLAQLTPERVFEELLIALGKPTLNICSKLHVHCKER